MNANRDIVDQPPAEPAVESGDPYQPFRRLLLSPERVHTLSTLSPWRAVVDVAAAWLVIVAAWVLVAVHPTWWTVALAIPVIGTRYYALFIIGHDGLHRRVLPRQAANDLFTDLLVLGPIGAITRLNNRNHLAHHRHLATELDPDRHRHGCFNKATRRELALFLAGLSSVIQSLRNVFRADSGRDRNAGASAGYTLRDAAILGGWQLALVAGLTAAIGWWAYPVLWLLPVYVFTFLADNLRSFAEHSHPESDAKADRHRLLTYDSHPLERLLLAPANMNLHAAHHLWPSIPYYNLPQADREIRNHPGAAGLEWRGSYLAYLWRYYRALPLPECRRSTLAATPASGRQG